MKQNGVGLQISGATIQRLYWTLFIGDFLLILATGIYDAGFRFALNKPLLELNLQLEGNVAVWYSSTLLALISACAYAISRLALKYEQGRWFSFLWKLAALFFIYISADETAQLHEKAGEWFTKHMGQVPDLTQGSYPVFAWLVIALPVAVLFIACMILIARWCRQRHTPSLYLIGFAVACWVGVLCSEFIQAQLVRWSLSRGFEGCIEEGFEIIGSTLFLMAFLELIRAQSHARVGAAEDNDRRGLGDPNPIAELTT